MTAISNNSASTAVGAALLMEFGAELGKLANFGQMQVNVGSMTGGVFQPAAQPFTATMPANGQAQVDLGDGNTLIINKASSEVQIKDAQGNVTDISGDPHVSVGGKHIGDFYGTTTFELKNGTKITLDTKAYSVNANAYLTDKVTVTHGDHALVISGVDQETSQPVSVTMGENGYALDAATNHGLVVDQSADGKSWISSLTGKAVTQADFDTTKPGAQPPISFDPNLGAALGLFLLGAGLGALISLTSEAGQTQAAPKPTPRASIENLFQFSAALGAAI